MIRLSPATAWPPFSITIIARREKHDLGYSQLLAWVLRRDNLPESPHLRFEKAMASKVDTKTNAGHHVHHLLESRNNRMSNHADQQECRWPNSEPQPIFSKTEISAAAGVRTYNSRGYGQVFCRGRWLRAAGNLDLPRFQGQHWWAMVSIWLFPALARQSDIAVLASGYEVRMRRSMTYGRLVSSIDFAKVQEYIFETLNFDQSRRRDMTGRCHSRQNDQAFVDD